MGLFNGLNQQKGKENALKFILRKLKKLEDMIKNITVGVGNTSVVTDNLDGTYTHDDGAGNTVVIDTNSGTPVDSRPYKVYSAIFTQSGTSAPAVTVLENTFTGGLIWSRTGTGNYQLASAGNEFTANQTVMFKGIEHVGLGRWIAGRRLSDGVFNVVSYNNSVPADSIPGTDSFPTFIEIRVYN